MNTFNPPPIAEVMARIEKANEEHVRNAQEYADRRKKAVEDSYMLLPLLEAEGVEGVRLWTYYMNELDIDLGEMPRAGKKAKEEFAARMRAVRRAVGCPLVEEYREGVEEVKDEAGGKAKTVQKFIKVRLKPRDYPHVTVTYKAKLGRGAKCKIVKQRRSYTEVKLVCEV